MMFMALYWHLTNTLVVEEEKKVLSGFTSNHHTAAFYGGAEDSGKARIRSSSGMRLAY